MMDKIVSYAKQKAKSYELYYVQQKTLNCEIENDKVNFITEGSTHGLSVRVFIDGKLGIAFTNDLDAFRPCIDNAIKTAKMNKPDPFFKSFAKKNKINKVATLNKKVRDIDAYFVHDFTKDFVQSVKEVQPNIMISSGAYAREVSEVQVLNSEGVDFFEVSAANNFYASLAIKRDGRLENTTHEAGSRDMLKPNGKEDAQRLLKMLDKKQLKSVECQAVLLPQASAGLFAQSYSSAVHAEHVQLKKSFFYGKLGEQVFPKSITVMDDATIDGLYASRSADVEGVPSKAQKVIKKGVLQGLLHNTYTAHKDGLQSTGNACRSLSSSPDISPTNLLVSGGKAKDVVKELQRGIVIRSLLGTHTMNELTGDFSLGVLEGWYVENGELKYPIKDVMVAGNFFEIMRGVQAMNKKHEHVLDGSGGFYLPAMLVEKLKVIGQ